MSGSSPGTNLHRKPGPGGVAPPPHAAAGDHGRLPALPQQQQQAPPPPTPVPPPVPTATPGPPHAAPSLNQSGPPTPVAPSPRGRLSSGGVNATPPSARGRRTVAPHLSSPTDALCSAAMEVIGHDVAPSTRRTYIRCLTRYHSYLQTQQQMGTLQEPVIGPDGRFIVERLTGPLFVDFCSTLRNRDGDNLSASSVGDFRAAVNHLFKVTPNVEMSREYRRVVQRYISSLKKAEATERHSVVRPEKVRTSEPLPFQAYQALAGSLLRDAKNPRITPFAHLFMVLCWNLMSRPRHVAAIDFNDMQWAGDALQVRFSQSKTSAPSDATRLPRHVYANPLNPSICPILSLAVHLACPGNDADSKLFPGTGQDARFNDVFSRFVKSHSTVVQRSGGVAVNNVTARSLRKGAAAYAACAATPSGPSAVAVFTRAGRSGPAATSLRIDAAAGDQQVGRIVSGLPCNHVDFATMAPHFGPGADDFSVNAAVRHVFGHRKLFAAVLSVDDDADTEDSADAGAGAPRAMLTAPVSGVVLDAGSAATLVPPPVTGSLPVPSVRRFSGMTSVLRHCLATLIYHRSFLLSSLCKGHPLRSSWILNTDLSTLKPLMDHLMAGVAPAGSTWTASGMPNNTTLVPPPSSSAAVAAAMGHGHGGDTASSSFHDSMLAAVHELQQTATKLPEQVGSAQPLAKAIVFERLNQQLAGMKNLIVQAKQQQQHQMHPPTGASSSGATMAAAAQPDLSGSNGGGGGGGSDVTIGQDFFWGGGRHAVPEDWTLETVPAATGWHLWWLGNASKGIGPYRALARKSVPANQVRRLEKWQTLFRGMEAKAGQQASWSEPRTATAVQQSFGVICDLLPSAVGMDRAEAADAYGKQLVSSLVEILQRKRTLNQ